MAATAPATAGGLARPAFKAVAMIPVPRGLVRMRAWPGMSPALVVISRGWATPVTARPYFSSGSSTECPPARVQPASWTLAWPPRSISRKAAGGRSLIGKQQMFRAVSGRPPMA